jgi:hypothetical protein
METTRESIHAIKTFTPESLGADKKDAGGKPSRIKRYEVLDRLARLGAGLSPGQKNDFTWFKETWDQEMVLQHGENWASVFSGVVQTVLEDERTNAFSLFMNAETRRVFKDSWALHVPGS